MNTTKPETTPDPTNETAIFANQLRELEAREAAIVRHLATLDRSADYAAVGEELCMICERKLYRSANFTSFKSYLASSRNPMSRSRADQLKKFAQARRLALREGRPPPLNERRVRATRSRPTGLNGFEKRWPRVFRYLDREFRNCPPQERDRFLEAMDATLKMFSCRAQRISQTSPTNTSVPCHEIPVSQLGISGSVPAASSANINMKTNSVTAQPFSPPVGDRTKGHATKTAVPIRGSDEPACPATEVESGIGLEPNSRHTPAAAQERPTPRADAGSVLALTIEEAQKYGYYPTPHPSAVSRQTSAPVEIGSARTSAAVQFTQTGPPGLAAQTPNSNLCQVRAQPTADSPREHSAVPTKSWLQGMSMEDARKRGLVR